MAADMATEDGGRNTSRESPGYDKSQYDNLNGDSDERRSRQGSYSPLPNKGFRATALRATLEEALIASRSVGKNLDCETKRRAEFDRSRVG